MPKLTIPVLVRIARDLGQQQANLDADDAGVRASTTLNVATELTSWHDSGREANDQGVIDAVDRYRELAPRNRVRIEDAHLDGYATRAASYRGGY